MDVGGSAAHTLILPSAALLVMVSDIFSMVRIESVNKDSECLSTSHTCQVIGFVLLQAIVVLRLAQIFGLDHFEFTTMCAG